jgi:DNA-binding NtrC family response regulator
MASDILGDSRAIRFLKEQIEKVAPYSEIAVLLLGEAGTGKELVAEAIHRLGSHANSPFVTIDCAAVPRSVLESEIFGRDGGARKRAPRSKRGLLEAAGSGTAFLDKVGEMPARVQARLLRVLETHTFRRVGSDLDLPLLARIVSATSRTSPEETGLRPELFYRLARFTISLPPLRERLEDVAVLSSEFLQSFSGRHQVPCKRLAPGAVEVLIRQPWPGNVRELRSLVEHLAIVAPSPIITAADVAAAIADAKRTSAV